jgi:hypothetical protein
VRHTPSVEGPLADQCPEGIGCPDAAVCTFHPMKHRTDVAPSRLFSDWLSVWLMEERQVRSGQVPILPLSVTSSHPPMTVLDVLYRRFDLHEI